MQLVFAPAVRLELLQIGETIEADSPSRAASFVRELEEKARSIALNPKIYRLRPELAQGIRLATHASYIILFASTIAKSKFCTSCTARAT